MGILQLPVQLPAQVGILPATKKMITTDNLATITAAAYLNAVDLQSNPLSQSDILEVLYSYNEQTKSGTFGIFTVGISNGTITLSQWADIANVTLPVVSGHLTVFDGTTGQLKDSGYLPSNAAKTVVPMVTSVPTVSGRVATFSDTAGTIQDSGTLLSALQVKANIVAAEHGYAGGGTSTVISNALFATSSVAVVSFNTQANAVYITTITLGAGSITVNFSGDPGACILSYVVFVAPQ